MKKVLAYGGMILLFVLLQCSFFTHLSLADVVPNAAGSDVWTLYWHVCLWLSAVRVSDRYRQSHFLQRGYYISCINDRCGRFVLRMLYVHFRLYDSRQIECAVLSEENHFTGGGIYCHYCDFPLQNHINYY